MTRKVVLEYVLLTAILFNVHAQALNAFYALSNVDSIPSVKRSHTPATPAADRHATSTVIMCANIGMVWRMPGNSNAIFRVLSAKDVDAVTNNDGRRPDDKMQAWMKNEANTPSTKSLVSAE